MKLKKKAAEMSQRELARFIDYSVLKPEFTEEEIVVITAMGVLMVANNYFNDILKIEV